MSENAGLPPLARRELDPARSANVGRRSTSARAERTTFCAISSTYSPVYLRSRGENSLCSLAYGRRPGLPPLARREPAHDADVPTMCRSTSARAERTHQQREHAESAEVYLRSRGENASSSHVQPLDPGLPPLARRERSSAHAVTSRSGSTSARAERTAMAPSRYGTFTVYLRSRGENPPSSVTVWPQRGLPPLARREHVITVIFLMPSRSTSARAERTGQKTPRSPHPQVYLRSRGENRPRRRRPRLIRGLPPLARRERCHGGRAQVGARSTSARAERTLPLIQRRGNHLR